MIDHDRLDDGPDVTGETPGERRAIDNALHVWLQYSESPVGVAPHWLPGRSPAFDVTTSRGFDELADDADDALAQSVDAIVDGLPRDLAAALRTHALHTRWAGPIARYAPTLGVARRALLASLIRRGFVVTD